MKHFPSLTLLVISCLCLAQSCKKSPTIISPDQHEQQLISLAKYYFHDSLEPIAQHSGNLRIDAAKTIIWEKAKVWNLSNGPTIIAPIQYKNNLYISLNTTKHNNYSLNDITHIFMYKNASGAWQAEIVTILPDSLNYSPNSKTFTGFIIAQSWNGQIIHQFKYNSDKSILTYHPLADLSNQPSKIAAAGNPAQSNVIVSVCYQISGYNYASEAPDDGYAWTETLGCTYSYVDEGHGGGSTGGGGSRGPGGPSGSDYGSSVGATPPLPQVVLVTSGPNIIADVKDYFKCFTNVGGTDHTYTVTVCVDQPVPGSRSPWRLQTNPSNSSAAHNAIDVGHTFLIFTENYGGKTITRNVGFYPTGAVYPWAQSSQGQLNDNEGTSYNISLSLIVDNAQFFNMINYVSQGNNPGYLYNISTNNCTTFVIDALQAGHINLSSQIGSWSGGSGYDPGDLGEDIRNMPLSSNMSRSTTENSHPNVGNCN